MVLCLRRLAATSLRYSNGGPLHRQLSTSTPVQSRRTRPVVEDLGMEEIEDMIFDETNDTADAPSSGHNMLQEQRTTLQYLRLIEHEIPKLVAFRKPFVPPVDTKMPLVVRSMNYGNSEHPATAKRAIVVHVDALPMKDKDAVHKLKLLAGPRWTPNPPADAGVCDLTTWGDGFIKVSCELFPSPGMNLKWASDTLDKLIATAHSKETDKFLSMPLDMRHVYSKARKAKKGDHRRNRVHNAPSLRSFPKEWLPCLD